MCHRSVIKLKENVKEMTKECCSGVVDHVYCAAYWGVNSFTAFRYNFNEQWFITNLHHSYFLLCVTQYNCSPNVNIFCVSHDSREIKLIRSVHAEDEMNFTGLIISRFQKLLLSNFMYSFFNIIMKECWLLHWEAAEIWVHLSRYICMYVNIYIFFFLFFFFS